MGFKLKRKFRKKTSHSTYQHVIMDFSIQSGDEILLSDELAFFLSVKPTININNFKSLFIDKDQMMIEDILVNHKKSSSLIELLEKKICKISFNKNKKTGYMIYLPEVNDLKESLNQSLIIQKKQEAFLYQMSHELKTPLSAIASFIELLKDRDLDQESLSYLLNIEKAYDQGLYQMNSILELSKLNYQNPIIKTNEIELLSFFEDIEAIFSGALAQKDLSFYMTHHKVFRFIGDLGIIKQIITNIISNAIKFTQAGSISVETNLLEKNNQSILKIVITDTGIGMTEEELENMFSKFFQANPDISTTYGGSGLGLSISYKLLTLLNGTIEVESQYMVGTSFSLEIPVKPLDFLSRDDDKQIIYDKPRAGLSILLAEDNTLSLTATKKLLKQVGLHVDVAKNGKEAFQKFLEYPFDLILMDVSMPVIDGFESSLKIRERDLNIPIIAVTANNYDDHYKKCMDSKMNDVLYKPFKAFELYHIISKYTK